MCIRDRDNIQNVYRQAATGGVLLSSMGNPHCVVYVPDTAGLNLPVLGGAMEHSKWFPEGVNTCLLYTSRCV